MLKARRDQYTFGRPGEINRAFDRYQAAMNLAFLRAGAIPGATPKIVWWQPKR